MKNDALICPICGAKIVVIHMMDSYDNADFGWDAGCPRYKVNDGIHNRKMVVQGLGSKEAAEKAFKKMLSEMFN